MFKLNHQTKKLKLQADEDPLTGRKKSNVFGILSICILTFSLGIAWYISGGIANPLMVTFPKVHENIVNLALTLYMIGVISSGVLIPLFCFKINRKWILLGSAVIFCLGNIIIGVSTNFGMLLFFRFLTGFAHGSVFAVGQ